MGCQSHIRPWAPKTQEHTGIPNKSLSNNTNQTLFNYQESFTATSKKSMVAGNIHRTVGHKMITK
jgi:ferric iron reductase protein FhuF